MTSMKLLMESWRQFEAQDALLQELSIMKTKYPFKAIYVVGPAGAGKSYLGSKIGIPKGGNAGFETLNTDDRVENVFRAYNISMKFASHDPEAGEEPSDEEKLQQNVRTMLQNADHNHSTNLVLKGTPLLFDTTGQDVTKISGRIQRLVDMGYDVAIFQINVPPSVSVTRDHQRGEEGDRSVGEPRVREINNTYQDQVVQKRGYSVNAANINSTAGAKPDAPYVTILGGQVIPNIYALEDFKGAKAGDLTVTPEEAAEVGNPSFAEVQKMLEKARTDLQGFLSAHRNPKGTQIINGMRALIRNFGGGGKAKDLGLPKGFSKGQSLRDLWAVRGTKWAQIPEVAAAISAMGGDPGIAVGGAVRGKKGNRYPGEPESVRATARKYGTIGPDEEPEMSKYQARGTDKLDPEKGHAGQDTAAARRHKRSRK